MTQNALRNAARGTIRFFAVSLILLSVVELLLSLDFRRCVSCATSLPKGMAIASLVYSVIACVLGIITGFGLLRLRAISRFIGIVLALANMIVGVCFYAFSQQEMQSYLYSAFNYACAANKESFDAMVLYSASGVINTVSFSITFLYRVCFIVYFLLPQVRQKFLRTGAREMVVQEDLSTGG
jgi:hypothetical protein